MKAAVIQFDIGFGAVRENQRKAEAIIKDAARAGAELVMLPELWNCGFALSQIEELAQVIPAGSTAFLQALAKELNINIIGGSIAERKEGVLHNTSVAIDNKGVILEKHRKTHLFPLGFEEHHYFTPGNEWNFANIGGFKVGMMVCYDIRFPEYARNLALRGAEIMSLPSQFTDTQADNWHVLGRARALENQCYFLASNRIGDDGTFYYPGESFIVSPYGDIMVQADNKEGFVMADINKELLHSVHKMDTISHRRRILDEIDDNQI